MVDSVASWANAITVARLLLSPLMFLAIPEDGLGSWFAFFLWFVLCASDGIDGWIARKRGPTAVGAFLDPLADKVVVIGAAVCLVSVDRLHWLPVAIIIVRELWVSALRIGFARQGLSVPATTLAKWKTFIQGIALMLAVLPLVENQQWLVDGAIWIAVGITVVTGWQYVRDGASLAD